MSLESLRETAGHLLAAYGNLSLRHKVAVWGGPVVVVVLVAVVATGRSPGDEFDELGRLIQRGAVAEARGVGTYEVRYPRPYASRPELIWLTRPMRFRVLEERSDGFRLEITLAGPHDLPPRWEARGTAVE